MEDLLDMPDIFTADDVLDGAPAKVPDEIRTPAGVLKQVAQQAAASQAPALVQQAPTAVATKQGGDVDLQKIDLEAVALAQFTGSRAAIAKATETLTDVVHDLSTSSKLADAKSLRERLINAPLAEARKIEKGLKSKLAKTSKAVGAALESIEADFAQAETLITPQIAKREAEIEAERAEKARLEALAVAENEARCDKLRGYIAQAAGKTSEQIGNAIAAIDKLVIAVEKWGNRADFVAAGEKAKGEVLVALRRMQIDTKTAEDNEALRAENARLAAEVAESRRVAAEAAAAVAARQAEENARAAAAQAAEDQAAKEEAEAQAKAAEVERLQQEVAAAPPTPVVAEPEVMRPDGNAYSASVIHADEPPPAPATMKWEPRFVAPKPAAAPAPAPIVDQELRNDPMDEAPLPLLLAHIAKAFERFPSNPKVTPEWWADLRRLAAEVQA